MPVSTYGDGIKKVLLLANAIVQAAHGILLIDEVETAIHTKYYDDIFRFLLKACKQYEIQLFITTHNLEALDALLETQDQLLSLKCTQTRQVVLPIFFTSEGGVSAKLNVLLKTLQVPKQSVETEEQFVQFFAMAQKYIDTKFSFITIYILGSYLSLITLEPWERLCFGMLDLAKRKGWNCT